MYIRRIEIRLILLVCLITSSIMFFFIKEACNTNVQASSLFMGDGQTKVVMISIDYSDIKDIAQDEFLSELFNKSYSALVSSRQKGKTSLPNVKLSIGTGKRLMINSNLIEAFNSSNTAPSLPNRVQYADLKELQDLNSDSEYLRYIGYLGDKLHTLGKTTCILGNSDTDIHNISNILIAMDSNGIVDYGDVENTVISDEGFPGGKRTDFAKLMEQYKTNLPASDFLIIDTGDLSRIEYFRNKLTDEEYQLLRKQAVKRISDFVKSITQNDSYNTTYILLSAYPTLDNIKNGDRLTPIIAYTGKGSGLLYSKSTRREGIITSLDIADYVIAKLDSKEQSLLQEKSAQEPLKNLQLLKQRILNVSYMRLPVLTWYAVLEIFCAVIGLIYILNLKLMKSSKLLSFVRTTLLVNIFAPVVFLYLAAIDIAIPYKFFILFIPISYIIAYIMSKVFKHTINRFAAASLLVNFSLIIDLMRNSILIKSSVFGYDPIIGARFYGIGNEFAGVYLGSSILAAGCLLEKHRTYVRKKPIKTTILLLIYFAIQLYMLGMPAKGANFGATIAAVCGFFFFFYSIAGKKIKVKHLFLLVFIMVIVVSTVIYVDLIDLSNSSHIGRFITDIKENGVKVLLSTFSRKLEMNLRLLRYTIWTKVLLCIILIITIMFFKPVRLLHGIFKKYQYLTASWLGISASSIAGLIVNDSGIVMAATAMIFTGYTILYICLEEMESEKNRGIKWTIDI